MMLQNFFFIDKYESWSNKKPHIVLMRFEIVMIRLQQLWMIFNISIHYLNRWYISTLMNVCIFLFVELRIVLVLCSNMFKSLLFIYFKFMKNCILFVRIGDLDLFNLLLLQLTHLGGSIWTTNSSSINSSRWRLGCNLWFLSSRRL